SSHGRAAARSRIPTNDGLIPAWRLPKRSQADLHVGGYTRPRHGRVDGGEASPAGEVSGEELTTEDDACATLRPGQVTPVAHMREVPGATTLPRKPPAVEEVAPHGIAAGKASAGGRAAQLMRAQAKAVPPTGARER